MYMYMVTFSPVELAVAYCLQHSAKVGVSRASFSKLNEAYRVSTSVACGLVLLVRVCVCAYPCLSLCVCVYV